MPGPRAHWEGGDQAGDPFAVTPKGQGEIPGGLVPSLAAIPAGMRKKVPPTGHPHMYAFFAYFHIISYNNNKQ